MSFGTSFGLALPASIPPIASDFLKTFVILSAFLLPIKSPVAFAVFRIALFDAVFTASVVDFLALSRSF